MKLKKKQIKAVSQWLTENISIVMAIKFKADFKQKKQETKPIDDITNMVEKLILTKTKQDCQSFRWANESDKPKGILTNAIEVRPTVIPKQEPRKGKQTTWHKVFKQSKK